MTMYINYFSVVLLFIWVGGGVLTSTTNVNMVTAMKVIVKNDSQAGPNRNYTGIHASYNDGEYTTVTGGVLTAPTNKTIFTAKKEIVKNDSQAGPNRNYTEIHATYNDGGYTTVTGGVLTSPTNENIWTAMKKIVKNDKQAGPNRNYTGIHATYNDGGYTTVTDAMVDDYQFVSEIGGFLKLHRGPAKWKDARLRCNLEGGVLASPTNENMLTAMKEIVKNYKQGGPDRIYTGIHATYNDGDYTTVTGIPLSQIDVTWAQGESNIRPGQENCLIMSQSWELAVVDCDTHLPYFCLKSKQKKNAHVCARGYNNSDYKLDYRTGSCYKFHVEARSWPKAFMTCIAEGAYLAIINSETESQVLKELYSHYPDNAIPGNIEKGSASVGFTMWKENGDWYTVHGQSLAEAGFSTFNPGEPNNVDGVEWCGGVMRSGLFNDIKCFIPLTFICEKNATWNMYEGDLYL